MVVAAPPRRLIPQSRLGPEVLARLPLHRPLQIFARHGVTLSERTVNPAVRACAERLSPLVGLLKAPMLSSGRIFTDDTPIIRKGNSEAERYQARLGV